MAISLKSWASLFFLLLAGFNYFTLAQEPDDTETFWKGNQRLIALEDIYPLKKKRGARWMRGWGCGWTPYGLCFSPDWRMDIHDNFILPFKDLVMYAYCDQPADTEVFGIGSVVLTKFSKKRDRLLEGRVYRYDKSYNWRRRKHTTYRIFVRTEYYELGVKDQIEESFHPDGVRLKGGYNACRYFKTECRSNEICVPRRLSGRIWPAEYKCVCKEKGWQTIRGRGCVDVDECEKSPCGALFVCINTMGSYKCECLPGYKGSNCDVEIDECEESPCPKNSVCKNVPGSFQCTCLPGFTGKDCSETEGSENDVETTQPTIREHTNKRIAIPRKRPIKIIRKPVFSYDPRHEERAAMIALMVVLNVLGMFLYWCQKRKRAKKLKKEQETRPSSDLELPENEEIILGDQLLENTEESILDSQELNQELKINSEESPGSEEMEDNEVILNNQGTRPSSKQEFENKETILDDQLLENAEETILNSTELNQELKINSEGTPGSEEMEDNELILNKQELQSSEIIPSNQELMESTDIFSTNQNLKLSETVVSSQEWENTEDIQSIKVLEYSETIPSSQELQDNGTVPRNQVMLENTQAIPSRSQDLENNEVIPTNQGFVNTEAVLVNDVWENMEALSSNQTLVNTETVHISELQAFEEEEIANDRELLADKSDE